MNIWKILLLSYGAGIVFFFITYIFLRYWKKIEDRRWWIGITSSILWPFWLYRSSKPRR